MFNHEPKNYRCPFCLVNQGVEGDFPYTRQADIFYKNETFIAFIASHWWPNNKGHVIIVPRDHFENLYDIPDELLDKIHRFSKKVAVALKKTYNCDGVSLRQHNEPSGDQDVWHYHLHVFPRYAGDKLYEEKLSKSDPKERIPFANKLKDYFSKD